MTPAEKAHLAVVPEAREPVVIGQEAIMPDDPRYEMAWRCREIEVALQLAEKDLRTKRAQIKKLQADADLDRKTYVKRELVERLFDHWREKCRHPRSKLTAERFDAARAMIEKGYGEVEMLLAIDGAAFDPFTRLRKNQTVERFDDLELIFRDGVHLERFANRAPVQAPAQGVMAV